MTETIVVNGQTAEIETRQINLIFKTPEMLDKIEYPKRLSLTPEVTTHHARLVQKLHPEFWDYFAVVFPAFGPYHPVKQTADHVRTLAEGPVHIMGLIDMSLKLQDEGIPFVWIHPETHLHPAQAVELGDLVIKLSYRGQPCSETS